MNRSPDSASETTAELPARQDPRHVGAFPWTALPSLEADDVETGNRLLGLLPFQPDATGPLDSLADELAEITDREWAIDLHRCRVHDKPPKLSFGDAFMTRFRLPPGPEVGALAVDMPLVEAWIATMPETEPKPRRPGEIADRDFGLATYVCLRLFERLEADHGAPPVVLPTEPPLRDTLRDRLGDSRRLVEAVFTVAQGGRRRLARLLLPEGLIANLEGFTDGEAVRRARTATLLDGPLADTHVELTATLGRTDLRRLEFRQLGRGDVILLEHHGFVPDLDATEERPPESRLNLTNSSEIHYLAGHLVPGSRHWKIRLDTTTPRTARDAMSQTNDQTDDSTSQPGPTAMLEVPETTLEVRLGSVQVTLRELGDLSSGQVLQLDRRGGADAELVVDGRIVGHGELVEVEGEIGVRIRHIDQ